MYKIENNNNYKAYRERIKGTPKEEEVKETARRCAKEYYQKLKNSHKTVQEIRKKDIGKIIDDISIAKDIGDHSRLAMAIEDLEEIKKLLEEKQ